MLNYVLIGSNSVSMSTCHLCLSFLSQLWVCFFQERGQHLSLKMHFSSSIADSSQ